MSLLSSNNVGIQSTIKQWWVDIRTNNSSSWDVSSSEITVVKADDGYVILDRSYISSSIKILSEDWNKRSRLLRGIYTCYNGTSYHNGTLKRLRSIPIDIISAEQDTEIDFVGITDKLASQSFDSYLQKENDRWRVTVMSPVTSVLKVHGLHRDNVDIKIGSAEKQEIYDFEGDINIKIDSNDSWTHCLKDVKTTSFVRFDMRGTCNSWEFIQTNRKKDRWGFVLNPKYLNDIDEFYKRNNGRMLFNLEIPPDQNISYDWWQPIKVTYEVSKCNRYGYRLIDVNQKRADF